MARGIGYVTCAAAALMAVALAAPSLIEDQDQTNAKAGVDAKAVFARLKTLAGTWKCQISDQHKPGEAKDEEHKAKEEGHAKEASVIFKLTGAGSALVETQFPGSGHEMVSVYHLDGDDLRMTHYCAAGNQPRVKLDRTKSTPEHLIFVFDGGTNLDPAKDMHIHGLEITFHEDGKVTSDWEGYTDGKSAGKTSFQMTKQ